MRKRELERALARSEAEVEFLRSELAAWLGLYESERQVSNQRIDRLLTFITMPEQAAIFARADQVEHDYGPPAPGNSPEYEQTVGQQQETILDELRARGVSEEDLQAALADGHGAPGP